VNPDYLLEKGPLAHCEFTIDYLCQLMSMSADRFENPPVEIVSAQ
jgi:hypothetical protein